MRVAKDPKNYELNEDLAEFIGILLGDGSIGIYTSNMKNKQYRIKITLNSIKDLAYSKYISKQMERIFNQKPRVYKRKGENTLDLYLLGKQNIDYLLNLGLVLAPKWGRAIIPDKFLVHPLDKLVVRGYMDTDGCVCNVNNNGTRYPRIEMKICPSPMQNQIIDILDKNGFEPQINRLERGKVRIALSGKKKLKKWIELIGFSNKRNSDAAGYFMNKKI